MKLYWIKRLNFLKAFSSPFKRPKLKWYCGKLAIGTPYFYPRRWVNNPDQPGYQMAIPKKIGFDFVGLGWKTKFDDYRFEYAPLISFVFFKWQIAVIVNAPAEDYYWEAWLYYEKDTDKTKSKEERIQQCIKEYPLIWKVSKGTGNYEVVNYYERILRKKYLKYINNEQTKSN